ncbi:MAG: oligoendopeptidase F family protein, partial [Melioribacteraceae bacterium]
MLKDLDLAQADNSARDGRVEALASKLSAASSFMRPEILSIPEDKLLAFVNENKELKVYELYLKELIRT